MKRIRTPERLHVTVFLVRRLRPLGYQSLDNNILDYQSILVYLYI